MARPLTISQQVTVAQNKAAANDLWQALQDLGDTLHRLAYPDLDPEQFDNKTLLDAIAPLDYAVCDYMLIKLTTSFSASVTRAQRRILARAYDAMKLQNYEHILAGMVKTGSYRDILGTAFEAQLNEPGHLGSNKLEHLLRSSNPARSEALLNKGGVHVNQGIMVNLLVVTVETYKLSLTDFYDVHLADKSTQLGMVSYFTSCTKAVESFQMLLETMADYAAGANLD